MNSNKAQGATEYMIIIAVVIIIALLVVIVMKGVPSIGKTGASRTGVAFWETADIGFMSYAVDSSKMTMNIRNNYKNAITITRIELDNVNLTTSPALPETLAAGEEKTFTSTNMTCTAGDGFSYNVEVDYTDEETDSDYTFTGTSNKLEGTCAS